MIQEINHITLGVQDLERDFQFYTQVLGLKALSKQAGKDAFFKVGETWLALVQDSNTSHSNYSHLAFSISEKDLPALRDKILAAGAKSWQENSTHGESFYFEDFSGNKLELHCSNLEERLKLMQASASADIEFY